MAENAAFEKFIDDWKKRIEGIKSQSISKKDSVIINLQFQQDELGAQAFQPRDDFTPEYFNKFQSLETDLELARTIADAKYQKLNMSVMEKEANIKERQWRILGNCISLLTNWLKRLGRG